MALRSGIPQSEQEIFIADSGASVHLTGSIEGLNNDRVTVGDGTSTVAEKIGDKNITMS